MRKVFDWAAPERDFPPLAGRGRGDIILAPALDFEDYLETRRAIRELPERKLMPTDAQLPNPITAAVVERFAFTKARRITETTVSAFVVAANTPIVVDGQTQYPSEPYRVAVEPNGEGVYPILESVFQETYVEVSADA